MTIGFGFLITTPLFQINFFPDLIHVYFLPLLLLVAPTEEHVVPGFIAASEGKEREVIRHMRDVDSKTSFFTR